MKYRKIVALIVETSLFIVGISIIMILDGVGINTSIWPEIIITGVYLFVLVLTLSLIRYDVMRDIRSDFKKTNLPLYTDQTTMMCHDLVDEARGEESNQQE